MAYAMDTPFAFCMIGSFALGVGSLTAHRDSSYATILQHS
jgi:hypothetical protein